MKNTILHYNIFEGNLDDISIKDNCVINTINPHSYVVAKTDKDFNKALLASDILLPDGIGVVYAIRFLKKKAIRRIAGYDIFLHLMKNLNETNGSCFFLGSSRLTLNIIQEKLKKEYPNVKVNSFSPPFKKEFTKEDNEIMISKVNTTKPDVLFVGMTAPKQEKWSFQNKNDLEVPVICSIGAVFDFYADTIKRPGRLWIYFSLEWFLRLIKNPRKLWRRTFISTPLFIKDVLLLKLKNI